MLASSCVLSKEKLFIKSHCAGSWCSKNKDKKEVVPMTKNDSNHKPWVAASNSAEIRA